MPSNEENVKYLYLVLTSGGQPNVEWEKVSEELDLKKGATVKRWSRLKQAMEKGTNPGPAAYQLLWLAMKHSARDKAMDWDDIAKKLNTTPGAATKRYSRLKIAFENGTAGPAPSPAKPAATGDGKASTPTKRKRGGGGNKSKTARGGDGEADPQADDEDIKIEDGDEDGAEKPKPAKRARAPKKTTKVKKGNSESNGLQPAESERPEGQKPSLLAKLENAIKEAGGNIGDVESEDKFYDAAEQSEDSQTHQRVENWLDETETV